MKLWSPAKIRKSFSDVIIWLTKKTRGYAKSYYQNQGHKAIGENDQVNNNIAMIASNNQELLKDFGQKFAKNIVEYQGFGKIGENVQEREK